MRILRRLSVLIPLLALGGCATLDNIFGTQAAPPEVPLAERPVEEPIDANRFMLASPEQTVVGEPQIVFTTETDTLSDLARAYGLGYDEIIAANPGINPWLPGTNTPIFLPTQFVLPNAPQRGVVLNIATKRLFYYPEPLEGEPREVLTYPIGIGRVGWETPLGETTVISKAKDPSWWPPASVRQEHAEMGDPLPAVVPPGPDNPLGTRVLKLDMPGYLIHGTNQPYGVGMRVSHGCVRLYPENIEALYPLVPVGEPVMIVNEPYQFGIRDGVLYFQAHAPLADDTLLPEDRLQAVLDAQHDVTGQPLNTHLKDFAKELAAQPDGVAVNIVQYQPDEVMARVRVVRNVVEIDPDAPTLSEIREMMAEDDDEQAGEPEPSL